MPGQDAFGAIEEIVQILDVDPKTDDNPYRNSLRIQTENPWKSSSHRSSAGL
jgi:hypothetical protein